MAIEEARDLDPPRAILDLHGEITPIKELLKDLVRRRDLLPMLAAKDFHSRYRSAAFGVLWSVLLPLVQGAVLAVVFTKVVHLPFPGGISYPIYVMTGTVLWTYFSMVVSTNCSIIVDQGGIAGKVYFPRMILAGVPALSNGVGFLISMLITIGLMPLFNASIHWTLILLVPTVLMVFLLAYVLGLLLSVAHVYFRDVKYMVQAALMVLIYAAPIIYDLDQPHGWIRRILLLNPMTACVQLGHFAMFDKALDLGSAMIVYAIEVTIIGIGAVLCYRRYERVACDRL